MPKASDLKRGSVIGLNGQPHVVEDLQIQTPSARGGASLYKIRFRNLITKHKQDRSCKGEEDFSEVDMQCREVQFSYAQADTLVFMDLEDYREFSLNEGDLENERQYLVEGQEGIRAIISEGRVLTIELPDVVELDVVECEPSIRGATAAARTKPAGLSTGLVVQVPEYLERGETIKVDTRTGKFLSRA